MTTSADAYMKRPPKPPAEPTTTAGAWKRLTATASFERPKPGLLNVLRALLRLEPKREAVTYTGSAEVQTRTTTTEPTLELERVGDSFRAVVKPGRSDASLFVTNVQVREGRESYLVAARLGYGVSRRPVYDPRKYLWNPDQAAASAEVVADLRDGTLSVNAARAIREGMDAAAAASRGGTSPPRPVLHGEAAERIREAYDEAVAGLKSDTPVASRRALVHVAAVLFPLTLDTRHV